MIHKVCAVVPAAELKAMVEGGFTVTVAVIDAPGQLAAVGVMVYVAVPGTVPVVLKVCAIVEPLALLAPDTPDWVTVHAYVVPVTVLVNAIDVAVPEQMVDVAGVAVATGVGFTVIVPLKVAAGEQPPVVVTV